MIVTAVKLVAAIASGNRIILAPTKKSDCLTGGRVAG